VFGVQANLGALGGRATAGFGCAKAVHPDRAGRLFLQFGS